MNSWKRRILKSFRSSRAHYQPYNKFISDENDFGDDDGDYEQEIDSENSRNQQPFQDSKINLQCRGDCGSSLMKFLDHTNLKIFKKNAP